MIKGKAKMEFGTGDIRMTGALSGGIGALCCITQEPHEIGEKAPVEDAWDTEQAEVILTFTKTESIDALIAELDHFYFFFHLFHLITSFRIGWTKYNRIQFQVLTQR